MEFIDLGSTAISPDMFDLISEEVARRFRVVPVMDDGYALTVAISDPLNFEILDTLPHVIGREINPVCASVSAIDQCIQMNCFSNMSRID